MFFYFLLTAHYGIRLFFSRNVLLIFLKHPLESNSSLLSWGCEFTNILVLFFYLDVCGGKLPIFLETQIHWEGGGSTCSRLTLRTLSQNCPAMEEHEEQTVRFISTGCDRRLGHVLTASCRIL